MAVKRLSLSSNREQRKGKVKSRLEIAKENIQKRKSKFRGISFNKKAFSALKKKKMLKHIGIISLVIASAFFVVFLVGSVYAFSMLQKLNDDLPSPDAPFANPPVASIIFDRNAVEDETKGTQLYKVIGDYNSDPVDIENVPEHVKWSFLAAEDIDFYTHGGFDTVGIIRCGINYIKNRGEDVCGASTITQQLLKITALSDEESKYSRKIKELLMSTKVEDKYEKDQILQMYLSVTPFGSNVVGIETASKYYFGVEPKELSIAQSAVLSAIIQNPASLSPTLSQEQDDYYCRLKDGLIVTTKDFSLEEDQDNLVDDDGDKVIKAKRFKCRQLYVIAQIENYMDKINEQNRKNIGDKNAPDLITQALIDEARVAELNFVPPVATDIKAGHFVDYVQKELTTKNYKNGEEPFTLSDLQNNGYRIYTTLDYTQQEIAERYVAKAGGDYPFWNVNNAAVLTIDPSNGQILTMAGSKSYFGQQEGCRAYNEIGQGSECKYDPQVNVLTSLNEPGSTAKVLAYTLAFEQGKLFGGSVVPDVPIAYEEIGYTPKNWDNGNKGIMNVREALIQSRNITALQAIELVGVDEYVKKAQELGNTTFIRDQVGPSIVLGGASVKYTEHTNLFAAFANGGNYVPMNAILKIEDRNGNVIFETKPPETVQVLSPQAVYMSNQILDNLQNVAGESGVPLSSKTGTTESNTEALQIAWNNSQVTLAWVGNNNNDPLDASYGYPVFVVQPWMAPYMGEISRTPYYQGKTLGLSQPGYVSQGGGGCDDQGKCTGNSSDWMIQGKTPPQDIEKKKLTVCIDQPGRIARPIDVATGNAVERDFIRYIMPVQRWQGALDNYLKGANSGAGNVIPTEQCTIDRSGGVSGPYFYIESPTNSQVLSGSTVNVKGGVFTNVGTIQSADVYFDGQQIGSLSNFGAFDATLNLPSGLVNGTYTMEIRALDSEGLTNSTGAIRVIVGSESNSNITFTMPAATPGVALNLSVSTAIPFNGGNVELFMVKNGGAPVSLGSMAANGSKSIGPFADEDATYNFYVRGSVFNTGTVISILSPALVI